MLPHLLFCIIIECTNTHTHTLYTVRRNIVNCNNVHCKIQFTMDMVNFPDYQIVNLIISNFEPICVKLKQIIKFKIQYSILLLNKCMYIYIYHRKTTSASESIVKLHIMWHCDSSQYWFSVCVCVIAAYFGVNKRRVWKMYDANVFFFSIRAIRAIRRTMIHRKNYPFECENGCRECRKRKTNVHENMNEFRRGSTQWLDCQSMHIWQPHVHFAHKMCTHCKRFNSFE